MSLFVALSLLVVGAVAPQTALGRQSAAPPNMPQHEKMMGMGPESSWCEVILETCRASSRSVAQRTGK
jgi:hypothetical protein